jgi:uncharacterized protein YcbX
MQISEIHLYPIKSLGGISVREALLTDFGLQHDRRWMLVDTKGTFLTQRKFPRMALLQPSLRGDELVVQHKQKDLLPLSISLFPQKQDEIMVQIWNDTVNAWTVDSYANAWFSEQLGQEVKLVYLPDTGQRRVSARKSVNQERVGFSDGTQHLIIGQASLDYLNAQLAQPVPMNRFRPNLVFTGGQAHAEDSWRKIEIGGMVFYGVGACIRCQVPNIDQDTGLSQKEPNRTLAGYRQKDHQVYFGMNLAHEGEGVVRVGMELKVRERREAVI